MFTPQKTSRALVIGAVMAAMAMVAIEATIVSTAMPQIVTQLGGLHLYAWVFSSFLLAQTAMTVVFGKLADLYGRKPIVLIGIVIFLIGSVLAGFAWSMPAMIAFRLIQGVGAGAIQPVTITIVADLYPPHERGKVQGYLASVWAISAIIGPMAGGLIIRDLSWAWIFWMNVPIGLASAAGFIYFLHEAKRHERPSIDILGAILFTVAIAALMIALTETGTSNYSDALLAVAVFIVGTLLFIAQERRAPDPMISFALWGHRPIAAANGIALLSGMALMGLTTFLPMYVQGVLQRSPVVAGLALTVMMVGWPVGATLAARSLHRFKLRSILIWGGAFIPAGAVMFYILTPLSSPMVAAVGSLVMGFGMGLCSVACLILIQEIVTISQRGSVTGSNIFSRNLGSTLGATVFGAVLNYGLGHAPGIGVITSDQLRQALDASSTSQNGDAAVRFALQHSLHLTFSTLLVTSLFVVVLGYLIPHVSLRGTHEAAVAEAL